MDYRSPSPGSVSAVESLASGEIREECIFNTANFEKIENNESLSLQLLSNCIILANCTILKERNLLPMEYFREFNVYGDVYGYIINQTTVEGKKLALTFNSVDVAIRERLINKLAIVVEETFNTDAVETFVWSFSYSASTGANAEIGYHGRTSKFSVNYADMDTTCQQFCKLIRDLRRIFKELRPLPYGMIPSLKVAYRGDPQLVDSFQPVEGFVDLKQIGVGTVAYPCSNGFHLTYASQFMASTRRPSYSIVNDNPIEEHVFSPAIEVARRRTMGFEEEETEERLPISPVPQDFEVVRSANDDMINGLSMACHPNVISQEETRGVLQSASVSPERIPDETNSKKKNAESANPRSIPRRSSQRKKGSKEKKSAKASLKNDKKTAMKYGLPEEDEEEIRMMQPKKKSARRLVPAPEPVKDLSDPEEEQQENEGPEPMETEKEGHILAPTEDEIHRTFGRVVSLLTLPSTDEVVEEAAIIEGRYDRVSSTKKSQDGVVEENPKEKSLEPTSVSERYGRVSSIRVASEEDSQGADSSSRGQEEITSLGFPSADESEAERQTERFGRTTNMLRSPMEEVKELQSNMQRFGQTKQLKVSPKEKEVEVVRNPARYGRVSSVLSTERSSDPSIQPRVLERRVEEGSPKTPSKYARVPSIKKLISEPKKILTRRD